MRRYLPGCSPPIKPICRGANSSAKINSTLWMPQRLTCVSVCFSGPDAVPIELTGARAKHCPIRLRRIGDKDANTGIHDTFLTHPFTLAVSTIADIYKARWQIELFFKWIKQKLKIKSFLGASKNAVLTQIRLLQLRSFERRLA